ncbi:MAG: hypothetical protein ACFCUQ_06035 [Kiloniellales bacterium]
MVLRILLLLVVLLVVGGAVFMVTWEIEPPSVPAEKVIPNDRFPR